MPEQSRSEKLIATIIVGAISVGCPILLVWVCIFQMLLPIVNPETVLHTATSPDGRVIALVISDGCGISCACTIRVDLKTTFRYRKQVFRGIDICDADITWLSIAELDIVDDTHKHTRIDTRASDLFP